MLKDGWKSVGKVFLLAMVLDVVYQIIEIRFVYPGEAIIVAFILAILPYLILHGLASRLARMKKEEPTKSGVKTNATRNESKRGDRG